MNQKWGSATGSTNGLPSIAFDRQTSHSKAPSFHKRLSLAHVWCMRPSPMTLFGCGSGMSDDVINSWLERPLLSTVPSTGTTTRLGWCQPKQTNKQTKTNSASKRARLGHTGPPFLHLLLGDFQWVLRSIVTDTEPTAAKRWFNTSAFKHVVGDTREDLIVLYYE